jgi:hypothetical protein
MLTGVPRGRKWLYGGERPPNPMLWRPKTDMVDKVAQIR